MYETCLFADYICYYLTGFCCVERFALFLSRSPERIDCLHLFVEYIYYIILFLHYSLVIHHPTAICGCVCTDSITSYPSSWLRISVVNLITISAHTAGPRCTSETKQRSWVAYSSSNMHSPPARHR